MTNAWAALGMGWVRWTPAPLLSDGAKWKKKVVNILSEIKANMSS